MNNEEKKKIELKKPPVLYNQTQGIIQKIQDEMNGDFLSYWISHRGSLVQADVLSLFKILSKKKRSRKLNLFIKSDGGSGKGALRMIHLLRNFYEEITALVPLECASAATMLVLGADEIRMGPLAYLTAIDTSITHDLSPIDDKYNDKVSVSQNELDRVMKLWDNKRENGDQNAYKSLYKYIHPLVFGSVDRASSLSIKLTNEILSYHLSDEKKIETISNHLNSAYPSHSYPITFREASKIGLKVESLDLSLNNYLLELNTHYSEMAQIAQTDYDELNYHDNSIIKVIETAGSQIFYQREKDWHYLTDERRYIPMNEESSWREIMLDESGELSVKKFYIK